VNYSEEEAYQKVSNWLASTRGEALDSGGCCLISQSEDENCLVMLPPNQTTLYFIASLYTPDLNNDSNLLIYCLELNFLFLTSLEAASIGLDADNRSLIITSAHPVCYGNEADLDDWLADFWEKASRIREKIILFFDSIEAPPFQKEGNYALNPVAIKI